MERVAARVSVGMSVFVWGLWFAARGPRGRQNARDPPTQAAAREPNTLTLPHTRAARRAPTCYPSGNVGLWRTISPSMR
jgi:hypothetical protein